MHEDSAAAAADAIKFHLIMNLQSHSVQMHKLQLQWPCTLQVLRKRFSSSKVCRCAICRFCTWRRLGECQTLVRTKIYFRAARCVTAVSRGRQRMRRWSGPDARVQSTEFARFLFTPCGVTVLHGHGWAHGCSPWRFKCEYSESPESDPRECIRTRVYSPVMLHRDACTRTAGKYTSTFQQRLRRILSAWMLKLIMACACLSINICAMGANRLRMRG